MVVHPHRWERSLKQAKGSAQLGSILIGDAWSTKEHQNSPPSPSPMEWDASPPLGLGKLCQHNFGHNCIVGESSNAGTIAIFFSIKRIIMKTIIIFPNCIEKFLLPSAFSEDWHIQRLDCYFQCLVAPLHHFVKLLRLDNSLSINHGCQFEICNWCNKILYLCLRGWKRASNTAKISRA